MLTDLLHTCLAMASSSQTPGAEQPPFLVSIFPFILIFVLMYFMLIRPQQKKAREADAMIKAVKTGDQVVAAGGIVGRVANVKDTTVILKVADNVKIEVLKTSIGSVTKAAPENTPAS